MTPTFNALLSRIFSVFGGQDALMEQITTEVMVTPGRRDGDDETRVALRWSLPAPPPPPPDDDEIDRRERFLLETTGKRLAHWDGDSDALQHWHFARKDGGTKGRCLIARDQQDGGRPAALLSWHYEPKPERGSRRPNLITAIALPHVEPPLRFEFLVAAWLLTRVVLAIDAKTSSRGRVGVVRVNAIALSEEDLRLLGFQKGRKDDGYSGDYWVLSA